MIRCDRPQTTLQIVSTLAPTGRAAESGHMFAGDVLHSVDGSAVQGLATAGVWTPSVVLEAWR